MSITNLLKRAMVQVVVYWGAPVPDGEGGSTFADPVELMVRWEVVDEVVVNNDGREVVSKARIWVNQDVDEQGWIYLGELDDLGVDPDDPKTIDGANEIITFRKIPSLGKDNEFVRRANLNITGSQRV